MNIISTCEDLISAIRLISIALRAGSYNNFNPAIEFTHKKLKISTERSSIEVSAKPGADIEYSIKGEDRETFGSVSSDNVSQIRTCISDIYFHITNAGSVDSAMFEIVNDFLIEPEALGQIELKNSFSDPMSDFDFNLNEDIVLKRKAGESEIIAIMSPKSDMLTICIDEASENCFKLEGLKDFFVTTKGLCDHRVMAITAAVQGMAGNSSLIRDRVLSEATQKSALSCSQMLSPSSTFESDWF